MKLSRGAFLLLPLIGVFAVDPLPYDFHAIKYLLLGVCALAVVAGAVRGGLLARTELTIPIVVFLAVRFFDLWRVSGGSPATSRASREFGLLLALGIVHHVLAAAAPRRWLARRLIPLLAGLGGAVAVFAILQRFSDARQAHAFFANRNFAGAGLAMLLPFTLAWNHRARLPLSITIVAGLLATGSRGGMLAAGVAGAFWIAQRLPRFRWAIWIGLPVALLVVSTQFDNENTVRVRREWYQSALRIGAEKPLMGHGADGFAREYPPVRPRVENAISGGRRVHAVHNDYLEAWVSGGLLGLAAMLFLVIAALATARRVEPVFGCWLAFSTAALVDLPWQDPGLLTIAFCSLSLVARPRGTIAIARPAALVGAVVLLVLLPNPARHWIADRAFGRYLESRRELDAVLRWEPTHREALIERSRPEDLRLLLKLEPHHGGAWHNTSRLLPDDEAIELLRIVLAEHDPHHMLSRIRLARLLSARGEKGEAATVLAEAIESDPRPVTPYVRMSRLLREADQIGRAEQWMDRIPPVRFTPEVFRELLELELASLRSGTWDGKRVDYLIRNLPPIWIQERIATPLERGEALLGARARPTVHRRADESALDHLERVKKATTQWRRSLRVETSADFQEAFLLSEALCRRAPSIERLRQKARAARGLGDVERAGHFESQSLFLETLEAIAARDPVTARKKFERALRAYPDLAKEGEVIMATRAFAAAHPAAIATARKLFAGQPLLTKALSR